MQDFKDLDDKQEIDISEMISKLNADQRRVFNRVTNTIASGKSLLRLYVSGEGGTGQLANHILEVLQADLKDVSLIIINKVSMISNLILMYIHLRLSEIFDTTDCDDDWFDQKHILLFGDLLQLPPVHEDPAFIQLTAENVRKYLGSLSATNLWITLFGYDKLIINMCQQGSYREYLLNKITINELCDFISNLSSDTVCLLPTCHMCNELNAAMLSHINKTTDYIEKINILLLTSLEYFIERVSVKFQMMNRIYEYIIEYYYLLSTFLFFLLLLLLLLHSNRQSA
ncbi:hypothetical protein ALC56_06938 [Trachymyrmex septentrionalis]|uniref:ATP-dependent DNA helicase n=1 Tax=Trachymyrmex septentrionalis TaxID=34720 RepID=A0A151JXA5_9HYME|nr:hypothetical protein ALC56_06938 [Trachymyrmex septentrionalis]